jgi:hypothetical protein
MLSRRYQVRNHFESRTRDAAGKLNHINSSTRARLGFHLIKPYFVELRRILNHDIRFRNNVGIENGTNI